MYRTFAPVFPFISFTFIISLSCKSNIPVLINPSSPAVISETLNIAKLLAFKSLVIGLVTSPPPPPPPFIVPVTTKSPSINTSPANVLFLFRPLLFIYIIRLYNINFNQLCGFMQNNIL